MKMKMAFHLAVVSLCGILLLLMNACGSSKSIVTLTLASTATSNTQLAGGPVITLTVKSSGSSTPALSWNISPASGCGTLAANGSSATFTPPSESVLTQNCTATVTVTQTPGGASTSVAYTFDAISITLPSGENTTQTATPGGAAIPLTAQIANDASGSATLNWKLQGCGSLSATAGTSINFTPPATGTCTATITASTSPNSGVTQVFTINVSPKTYTVGGTVSGLKGGTSFVLLDNGTDALTINADGPFNFPTSLVSGTTYQVSFKSQPTGQSCQAANAGPATITADVTNVTITCTAASSGSLTSERELTQTALGIALANNVLVSQIAVLVDSTTKSLACSPTSDGSASAETGSTPTITVQSQSFYPLTIFYGGSCARQYMVIDVTGATVINPTTATVQETITYYATDGTTKLGTMAVNETLTSSGSGSSTTISATGLGLFTAASGSAPPVQLGLYCTGLTLNPGSYPCAGGVAQSFPSLGVDLGAVTPLSLVLNSSNQVTFSGTGKSVTGATGSLKLTSPAAGSLTITGGTAYSTMDASGDAGQFELFPPVPTSWTLSDAAHDEKIVVQVTDNTTRDSSITITSISTGSVIATGQVDQSGTGSITYSDNSKAAITSWTLAN